MSQKTDPHPADLFFVFPTDACTARFLTIVIFSTLHICMLSIINPQTYPFHDTLYIDLLRNIWYNNVKRLLQIKMSSHIRIGQLYHNLSVMGVGGFQ